MILGFGISAIGVRQQLGRSRRAAQGKADIDGHPATKFFDVIHIAA